MKYRELNMYCMVFSNFIKYRKFGVRVAAQNPFIGRGDLLTVGRWLLHRILFLEGPVQVWLH